MAIFDRQGELTSRGRRWCMAFIGLYIFILVLLCWTPQPFHIDGVKTPNVFRVGQMVFLLVPFNSFVAFGELGSFKEIIWVVGQNLTNIFLIYPLVLGLLSFFPTIRNISTVLLISFAISLTIESGQLALDLLIDANRVFEIDDLWTNTLGGYLAYVTYIWLTNRIKSLD